MSLSLIREKGTSAGTVTIELNDLNFELTSLEREELGGLNVDNTTTSSEVANHSPNEGGRGSVVTVGGISNQMEGLLNQEHSLSERPETNSNSIVAQETQDGHQRGLAEAAALVGAARLLTTRSGGVVSSPTPPPPSVSMLMCAHVCVHVCVHVLGEPQ